MTEERSPEVGYTEYKTWFWFQFASRERFRSIVIASVVFILFAMLLGLFFRFAWSPIISAIGSYLLIDILITNSLIFERSGQANLTFPLFTARIGWRRTVSPLGAMVSFVFLIIVTGAIAVGTIIAVKWFDRFIPSPASVILWSLVVGSFLLASLLRQHREPIAPQQKMRTQPTPQQSRGETNGQ